MNQKAALRRLAKKGSASRRTQQQEFMKRALDLAQAGLVYSISSTYFKNAGAPRSFISVTTAKGVLNNSRPPGLHPRTPAHKQPCSSGCQVNAWKGQSYIAPHAHATEVAVTPQDGAGVVHCANDLT